MPAIARSQILDLFTLAIADGFVSPDELALIYEKGKAFGMDGVAVDDVIRNPHRVSFTPPVSLIDAIARLYDLARVLLSDGTIDPREVSTMQSFAKRFQIRDDLIDPIVAALVEEVRAGTAREALVSKLAEEVGQ